MIARRLSLGVLSAFVFISLLSCSRKPDPKNPREAMSYAIGQQVGRELRADGVDVDVDWLARSLKDALSGKESALTPQELQAGMMKVEESVRNARQKVAVENLKAGQEFLDKNKARPGVTTTASGLQIEIKRQGKGKKPKATDKVKVNYQGALVNGQVFDSSYERKQPITFGVGQVIRGWTEALQLLPEGSQARLVIPPNLAYGPDPRPGIPPNSVLVFDLEVLEVNPKQ